MGALQNKLMKELRKRAVECGYDFDVEYDYANTGHVYWRTGFKTLLVMNFDFQDNTATFQFNENLVYGTRHHAYVDYGDTCESDVENLINQINGRLKGIWVSA